MLVLSQYVVVGYASTLLADSPTHVGYLLKDRLLEAAVLDQALGRVASGETVIDPELVQVLLRAGCPPETSPLTARERDVLGLIAEGLSDRGIAERLVISTNTVGTHIQRIFTKLGLSDSANDNRRVRAVLRWLENLSAA